MTPYRVGYSGSRDYPEMSRVRNSIRDLANWAAQNARQAIVISGTEPPPEGVRRNRGDGVDETAIRHARFLGLATEVYSPDYAKYGSKRAPIERNGLIVSNSDVMIFYWSLASRGTADTIRKAMIAMKPMRVYGPDGCVLSVAAVGEAVRNLIGE